MQFENTRVFNFEGAIRGMRNPLNSWDKSDSLFGIANEEESFGAEVDVIDSWIAQENPNIEMYSEEYEDLFAKYQRWFNLTNADRCIPPSIESTDMSTTSKTYHSVYEYGYIGPKDLNLAQRLIKSGPEHMKFMRQIFVCVDITAPIYW